MKRGDAIRLIKAAGRAHGTRMTIHAEQEIAAKNLGDIDQHDIDAVLATGTTFVREGDD